MDPINYQVAVQDPFQSMLKGFQTGQAIRESRIKSQEEEQKKLMQAQMQKDFNELAANPTAENISALALKYPALSEGLKRGFDMMNETQRESTIAQGSQVYSALSAGKPEIAADIVRQSIEAHKNSGNLREQRTAELLLKQIEQAPEIAMTTTGLMLEHAMGGKFAESFAKQKEEQRKEMLFDPEAAKQKDILELKKLAADYELTSAQTNKAILEGRKVGVETAKTLLELENLKKTGGLDPTKKFDMEDKLRKQYVDRTGKYIELRGTFDVIKASASDMSGAGDMALVTSFMKMLDPTSVVRETEFAKAQDTAGLLQRLSNKAQQIQAGSFLDAKQRQDFERLAGRYLKAAEEHEKRVRKELSPTISSYGLNAENIFGNLEASKSPVPNADAPAVPVANAAAVSDTTRNLLDKYGPK